MFIISFPEKTFIVSSMKTLSAKLGFNDAPVVFHHLFNFVGGKYGLR